MPLLWLTEVALGFAVFVFLCSQVFLPMIRGTKLFPSFRGERRGLLRSITEAREARDDQELRDEASRIGAHVNKEGEDYGREVRGNSGSDTVAS